MSQKSRMALIFPIRISFPKRIWENILGVRTTEVGRPWNEYCEGGLELKIKIFSIWENWVITAPEEVMATLDPINNWGFPHICFEQVDQECSVSWNSSTFENVILNIHIQLPVKSWSPPVPFTLSQGRSQIPFLTLGGLRKNSKVVLPLLTFHYSLANEFPYEHRPTYY